MNHIVRQAAGMAVVEVARRLLAMAFFGAERPMGIASLLLPVAESVVAKPCQANTIPFTCCEVGHCATESGHQDNVSGLISESERRRTELCVECV